MAVKRCFNVTHDFRRVCLKCEATLPLEAMKDDTICTCKKCGQQMTVDRYGQRVVLTVVEKLDLRRRIPPEISTASTTEGLRILALMDENERLKKQLDEKQAEIEHWQQQAAEWEKAADGLAYMIEEMKQKEGTPDV